MNTAFKRFGSQSGQAIMLVTLFLTLFGMFVGLAVDGGIVYLNRAKLARIVDAASLAGAKAMGRAGAGEDPMALAIAAACDSARLNSLDTTGPSGTCPPEIAVTVEDLANPDGSTQTGVLVTGTEVVPTTFMRLGTLVGCGTVCANVTVTARGGAFPQSLVDIALVLDDTGTMNQGCDPSQTNPDCPIKQARDGAQALVDLLLPDGGNSAAQLALVPFRGCIADTRELPPGADNGNVGNGCVLNSEKVALTSNKPTLTTGISNMRGAGGYPGTNVCLGMHEGREALFGAGSRSIARKVMVVLTDGDNRFSDGAQSDADGRQPPSWAPPPAPPPQVPNNNSDWHDCRPWGYPQDAINHGADYDGLVNWLDTQNNNKATSIKDPNGDDVEVFVLRFAGTDNDDPLVTLCDSALVGTGTGRQNNSDLWDRNMGRCLATHIDGTLDAAGHFFYAATPTDIVTAFQEIAQELMKKLRLAVSL